MARQKTTFPVPTKQSGQRSQELPPYLTRWIPEWRHPRWREAEFWRLVVLNQPFAIICRETLISNILSLDWKIEPYDSTLRDEYRDEINYYTKFFTHTGDYSFSQIIEWTGQDYFDIPFGTGVEKGYKNDNPDERLLWIELLDGSTLYPTRNRKWPVGQSLKENPTRHIYFPKHAISRMYMSPRVDMMREGWGMAPPEKIYLTLELLRRGDIYYANLLLDTPEVGVLDLMDMEKTAAQEWVKSWGQLLSGIDPFKIPVLYEHTQQAKFISFTRSPTELMFDKAVEKYAALTAAGYGMSLSDIGIQAIAKSGETLAGSIRQERRTRRTGFARTKKAYKAFFGSMLPEYLYFHWIDLDDELSTAMGRSRLASATAASQLVDLGVFTPDEMRQQIIADGLITISVPEIMPEEERRKLEERQTKANERPSLLGKPIAPSSGGRGEVMESDVISKSLNDMLDPENIYLEKLVGITRNTIIPEVISGQGVEHSDGEINEFWNEIYEDIPELQLARARMVKSRVFDLIDWCQFPIERARSEWLEVFHDVVGEDNTVLDDEFVEKFDDILIGTEISIRDLIADAISVSASLDENEDVSNNINDSLKEIYTKELESVTDELVNLIQEYRNGK